MRAWRTAPGATLSLKETCGRACIETVNLDATREAEADAHRVQIATDVLTKTRGLGAVTDLEAHLAVRGVRFRRKEEHDECEQRSLHFDD